MIRLQPSTAEMNDALRGKLRLEYPRIFEILQDMGYADEKALQICLGHISINYKLNSTNPIISEVFSMAPPCIFDHAGQMRAHNIVGIISDDLGRAWGLDFQGNTLEPQDELQEARRVAFESAVTQYREQLRTGCLPVLTHNTPVGLDGFTNPRSQNPGDATVGSSDYSIGAATRERTNVDYFREAAQQLGDQDQAHVTMGLQPNGNPINHYDLLQGPFGPGPRTSLGPQGGGRWICTEPRERF